MRQTKKLDYTAVGYHGPGNGFHVDGVYIEDGIRIVIYGEVTLDSLPRLEVILAGLSQLHPKRLTVQFDALVDVTVISKLGRFERGEVEFYIQREPGADLISAAP